MRSLKNKDIPHNSTSYILSDYNPIEFIRVKNKGFVGKNKKNSIKGIYTHTNKNLKETKDSFIENIKWHTSKKNVQMKVKSDLFQSLLAYNVKKICFKYCLVSKPEYGIAEKVCVKLVFKDRVLNDLSRLAACCSVVALIFNRSCRVL